MGNVDNYQLLTIIGGPIIDQELSWRFPTLTISKTINLTPCSLFHLATHLANPSIPTTHSISYPKPHPLPNLVTPKKPITLNNPSLDPSTWIPIYSQPFAAFLTLKLHSPSFLTRQLPWKHVPPTSVCLKPTSLDSNVHPYTCRHIQWWLIRQNKEIIGSKDASNAQNVWKWKDFFFQFSVCEIIFYLLIIASETKIDWLLFQELYLEH